MEKQASTEPNDRNKPFLRLKQAFPPTEISPPTKRCPHWYPSTKRCPPTEKQALKEEGIGCGIVSNGVPKLSLDLKADVKGKLFSASLSLAGDFLCQLCWTRKLARELVRLKWLIWTFAGDFPVKNQIRTHFLH
ncbi:hypothetical protein I3760_14G112500 [Carya illinoinensis]|nr:hypothetical protein I3760_14G112500 [Carya illinoinensis]